MISAWRNTAVRSNPIVASCAAVLAVIAALLPNQVVAMSPMDRDKPPAPAGPQEKLVAEPASGVAPLTVTFRNVGISIDFGDGSLGPNLSHGAQIGTVKHTYTKPGTYTAGSQRGHVTVHVTAPAKP
jgi:PKD repeat protein